MHRLRASSRGRRGWLLFKISKKGGQSLLNWNIALSIKHSRQKILSHHLTYINARDCSHQAKTQLRRRSWSLTYKRRTIGWFRLSIIIQIHWHQRTSNLFWNQRRSRRGSRCRHIAVWILEEWILQRRFGRFWRFRSTLTVPGTCHPRK